MLLAWFERKSIARGLAVNFRWAAKSYWDEARTGLAASHTTQGKDLLEECDEANQAGDSSGSFDDDSIGVGATLYSDAVRRGNG
jgi:hypothetical protein